MGLFSLCILNICLQETEASLKRAVNLIANHVRLSIGSRLRNTDIQGWFALDFVSLIASVPDIVQVAASSSSGDLSRFKLIRVMRVIRLVKLLRLLRASRMLARWETRVAVNYAVVSLSRSISLLQTLSFNLS